MPLLGGVIMSINLGIMNAYQYGNHKGANVYRNVNPFDTRNNSNQVQNQNKNNNQNKSQNGTVSATRMLSDSYQKRAEKQGYGSSIVNDSINYANSLSAQRTKSKDTATQIKKLQYDFKGISSQILKSKTSLNAKQVASKARREVLRLKRQKGTGEYDDEEIQSAILHAQAMERVAKKKARHLQEEEMVKAAGGKCQGSFEDDEDKDDIKDKLKDELSEQFKEEIEDSIKEEIETSLQEEMQEAVREEMQEEMQEELEEQMQKIYEEELSKQMSEAMDEFESSMEEMMDEMSLKDLMEEFGVESVDRDMDPADFKMMKLKHRTDEMKAIAKADSDYLKQMFERYEKMKSGMSGMGSAGAFATSGAISGGITPTISSGASSSIPNISIGDINVSSLSSGIDVSV